MSRDFSVLQSVTSVTGTQLSEVRFPYVIATGGVNGPGLPVFVFFHSSTSLPLSSTF